MRVADLPRDRRGIRRAAEAAWTADVPVIETLCQSQTFALAFMRACAVSGYRLEPGETVWRLLTQVEASLRRLMRENLLELANPGHLLCMLYSSQICPFWSRAEARLGKESEIAHRAKRGTRAALLGFDNHYLLLPLNTDIHSAQFLYRHLTDDIPFKSPSELADRYAEELAVESGISGDRAYWTNSTDDLKALDRVLRNGRKITQCAGAPNESPTVLRARTSTRSASRSSNPPSQAVGQAVAHGDEHVIKFADTAVEVHDPPAIPTRWPRRPTPASCSPASVHGALACAIERGNSPGRTARRRSEPSK
jgi:hypothetical protein